MKKRALPFLGLLSLAGCMEPRIYRSPESHDYELIAVQPPKHMSVDLREVATGHVFRDIGVSKHCIDHRQRAVVGRVYRLGSRDWSTADGLSGREFDGLRSVFCG